MARIDKNQQSGGTQILSGGTQVLGGGTQVLTGGTQILSQNPQSSGGTHVIGSTQTIGSSTFNKINTDNLIGGLLTKEDNISGWKIISKIQASSGQAELYIAEKNGKKGVIKYYNRKLHPKKELLEKIKTLDHADVIELYEIGEYKSHFYEIMEYAAGGSIDSKIGNVYKYLPLKEKEVIQVCKEVVNSFKSFHEKQIIHRDIKPANLFYRNEDGTDVVVGDFGISSMMDESETSSHKTKTKAGTPGYASKEVLSGIISPKMDYYALGITLWQLATGKEPFVDDNGEPLHPKLLLRDAIEGRTPDHLLSQKPFLSKSLQKLIRGLLISDQDNRWGYDEVMRHLNGEDVPLVYKPKLNWTYEIGGKTCSNLEDIAKVIAENPENCKKDIYQRLLSGFLEDKYPDLSKEIDKIVDESSATHNEKLGIQTIVWLLNPCLPYKIRNGYEANNVENLINLLINAPETMYEEIIDKESFFFSYLEVLDFKDQLPQIRNITKDLEKLHGFDQICVLYKIAVILSNETITPFRYRLEQYKDMKFSELSQLGNVPEDLQSYILYLIKSRSCEGLLLPWLLLKNPKIRLEKIETWKDLKASL